MSLILPKMMVNHAETTGLHQEQDQVQGTGLPHVWLSGEDEAGPWVIAAVQPGHMSEGHLYY